MTDTGSISSTTYGPWAPPGDTPEHIDRSTWVPLGLAHNLSTLSHTHSSRAGLIEQWVECLHVWGQSSRVHGTICDAMPGVEPRSTMCKANALLTGLPLWSRYDTILNYNCFQRLLLLFDSLYKSPIIPYYLEFSSRWCNFFITMIGYNLSKLFLICQI